jgi:hypothetical protein
MRKSIIALGVAGVLTAGSVSVAQAEVVLTGSALAGLTYSNGGYTGDSAGCVSCLPPPGTGGFIQLTTGDTQSGNPSTFNDVGTVLIPNGYMGVSLPGTLSDLVSTPGGASFDLLSATNAAGSPVGPSGGPPGGNGAYWNIELKNPNDGTTLILNTFGINQLGANNFSATTGGTAYLYEGMSHNIFGSWTTTEDFVVDSLALGSWDVTGLTISAGGWGSSTGAATDDIDSITLPGTETPLPAALPLFATGLGAMGLFGWRRKRKAVAVAAA